MGTPVLGSTTLTEGLPTAAPSASDGTDAAGFHAAIKQAQDNDAKNGFLARLKQGDNNTKKDGNTRGVCQSGTCKKIQSNRQKAQQEKDRQISQLQQQGGTPKQLSALQGKPLDSFISNQDKLAVTGPSGGSAVSAENLGYFDGLTAGAVKPAIAGGASQIDGTAYSEKYDTVKTIFDYTHEMHPTAYNTGVGEGVVAGIFFTRKVPLSAMKMGAAYGAVDGASNNAGDPASAAKGAAVGGAVGAVTGKAAGIVGGAVTSHFAGEPVSVATGEYVETWEDFLIDGRLSFDGKRYMGLHLPDPLGRSSSPLGPGQISAFDEVISNPDSGFLDFHQANGQTVRFERPFNFLASENAGYPHLDLRAPWLKKLELRDRSLIKHFRQYDDNIYHLEKIEDLNGNAIIFLRNETGLLEQTETSEGLALAFSNDTNGRRTRIVLIGIDGSRVELARYEYDARGRMTAAECAFGMSVRYYWHPERNLMLRWHNTTRRSETHFTYDEAGRVLHTRTNGIWNDDRFRYDPEKRETTYLPSGAEQLAQRFAYDENDNVTHETDALGHTLVHTFDAAGFEIATRDANGNASTTAYDIRGNVKRFVDAEGRATTYGWGPHGALDVVIDGAGKIRKYENDLHGNTIGETDAEGHATRYVRDARGRLIRTILPDGASESRTWDAHGRLDTIVDARGGITRFAHDVFGRTVEVTDALGGVTRYEYAAGAGGFSTPTALVRPDGVHIARAYTEDGVLASVTDGEGRRWTYTYGAFDVLQAIEDPKGGRLAFAYDGEGRVTGVTNQKGLTYALIRDAAGRVIAEEDFDGRRTEYTRDPGGRVVETTKPDGVRLAYTYDRTDKLTSIKGYAADDPGNTRPLEATHYWYDGRGLLIRASNQAALVEFERDGNGRIVSESVNGRKVESKLDARGNRIERRIGRGEPCEGLVRYAHDPLGMVASITIDGHAPLAFTRDALGRETRRASPKGFRLDQSWDAVGQVTTQSAGRGASGLAGLTTVRAPPAPGTSAERHYAWDKAGAPVGIDDLIWGETRYTYDANGQVAEASFGDGFTEKFDYDSAKNVAGVKLQGPEIGPGLGGLLAWQSTPGGVVQLARGPNGEMIALTHDVCGRVVTRRVDRKGFRPRNWHYGWDVHDRLVSCETPDGDTWFYRYDPFGRRITKVRKLRETELAWTAQKFGPLVPMEERDKTKIWTWPEPPNGVGAHGDTRPPVVGTHFTWDGDVVAEEAPLRLDGSVNWGDGTRWHFEPGGFRPLAKQTADGKLMHVVNDHLGTPHEMFDENGELRWTASFSTWGVMRGVQGAPKPTNDDGRAIYPRGGRTRGDLALRSTAEEMAHDCSIRFQGQWDDAENGLTYNHYRYYDQTAGQFVSPDPVGLLGGMRTQAYVDCPKLLIDPLGLAASGNVSYMHPNDGFARNVANRPDVDPNGHFDVIAHGTAHNIEIQNNGKSILINPRDLTKMLKNNKNYKPGQPVRLLSCSTGACDNGFAQNLSNSLGAPVSAPTDTLWAYPNGSMVVGPTPGSPTGSFRTFTPGPP